jgi:hypothetical protein
MSSLRRDTLGFHDRPGTGQVFVSVHRRVHLTAGIFSYARVGQHQSGSIAM